MEDQDRMLVQSLRSFGFLFDESLTNLMQLDTERLILIVIQFFEKMGMDNLKVSSLKSLKSSKFRQAAKLQEDLANEYGLRVEVQTLLNPNVNDSRKLVVNCLSRISAFQEDDKGGKAQNLTLTLEERIERERSEKLNLEPFVSQQWINPSLIAHQTNNQRFLRLHVKNIMDSEPILSQVSNLGLRKHLYSSLASRMKHIDHNLGQRDNQQKFEGWQGQESTQAKMQLIKKMRRQEDPEAFLQQFKGESSVPEQEDWAKIQQGGRTLQKAVKAMKEEEVEVERKDKEEANLFTLEIQFQKEIPNEQDPTREKSQSSVSQIETDLEQMRRSNRAEIDELSQQVKVRENQFSKLVSRRAKVEDELNAKNDRVMDLRDSNSQKQKQMESQHLMLTQVESKSAIQDMEKEISKLTAENETISSEWTKQKLEMEGDIQALRQRTQDRREKLDQYRDKIKRLEEENQQVKLEGRNNLEKKDALIAEFERMAKDAQRSTFIKKILELDHQLRKQQDEFSKVRGELDAVEQQIEFQNNYINRYYVELENLFQLDSKKKDALVTQITQKYQDYRTLYQSTISSIKEIAQRKIETQEAEQKLELIQSKGYKSNIDKLQNDLAQIKQENARMKA